MYERFTDRARGVMRLSRDQAGLLRHEYLGTEHMLLGLIIEDGGVAGYVLRGMELSAEVVRSEIAKIVSTAPALNEACDYPQTPRSKKAIVFAMEEARQLGHSYVGTEHVLLGLLRVPRAVGVQVLINLDLRLDDVRQEVLNILGHGRD